MAESLLSWSSDRSVVRPASGVKLAAGIAIGTLGAAAVSPLSADVLAALPALPYYPIVAMAALVGRLSAGACAVVASAVLLAWRGLPPEGLAVTDPTPLVAFVALAAGIALLVSVEEASRERLVHRRRQHQFLGHAMHALEEPLDRGTALQRMAESVVPTMASWCAVHLTRPDGGIDPVAAAHRDPGKERIAGDLQTRSPIDPSSPHPVATVIRSASPLLIHRIDDTLLETMSLGVEERRLVRELRLRSVIVAPLSARGRILGALTLVAEEPYGQEDLELAVELAQRAALSLDTLAALERSRRANERAERLQRMMAAVSRAATTDEVLRALVDAVISETDARAMLVALLDDDGRWLEVAAFDGYDPENIQKWSRFPVAAELPMSEAVATKRPVIVRDLEERAARYPLLDPDAGRPDHTLICLPLLLGSVPVGGISISMQTVREVDDTEVRFLDAVTRQAAASLRRARLYQERDRLATALQRALLPPEMPSARHLAFAARYFPSGTVAEIGGDFYDVLERDRDVIMVVGDVCGRGAEAASIMGMARYAAWGAAVRGRDLGSILVAVNDVLLANVPDDRFVTMAVVQVEIGDTRGTVRVASGGHPPPLQLGPKGIRPLGSSGPLLGVVADTRFPVETAAIAQGDSLLLYTDGIVERSGRHVPLYEDRDFLEALSGADLGDPESIVKCVERLLEASPTIADDAAILAASVTLGARPA